MRFVTTTETRAATPITRQQIRVKGILLDRCAMPDLLEFLVFSQSGSLSADLDTAINSSYRLIDISSFAGTLFSAAGLIVSIFALIGIEQLRRRAVFKQRASQYATELKHHSSNISKYMNSFNDYKHDIVLEIKRARGRLKALVKIVPSDIKPDVKRLIKRIDKVKSSKAVENEIRDIYFDISGISNHISEVREDIAQEP